MRDQQEEGLQIHEIFKNELEKNTRKMSLSVLNLTSELASTTKELALTALPLQNQGELNLLEESKMRAL